MLSRLRSDGTKGERSTIRDCVQRKAVRHTDSRRLARHGVAKMAKAARTGKATGKANATGAGDVIPSTTALAKAGGMSNTPGTRREVRATEGVALAKTASARQVFSVASVGS